MKVSRLTIKNFRCIKYADLEFDNHTLFVGRNNVGKSTIFEALDLALSSDRLNRFPVVEEYDFYNAEYLDSEKNPIDMEIDVLLTDLTDTIKKSCINDIEFWDPQKREFVDRGGISEIDNEDSKCSLRIKLIARYNKEEDEFQASTHYARRYNPDNEDASRVPRTIRRTFGFLYLRTLRTGSRALSLERGSLLDIIIRSNSLHEGLWEDVRDMLKDIEPEISNKIKSLNPILEAIESRISEYIPMTNSKNLTRLSVSQLTREHLRKTISLFLSISQDQEPVPFQEVGTGTLNVLVLALLSFVADLKGDNVIFAMEEPEIAIPPHTQRRISHYLRTNTTQCFVTSHSPYVIESFEANQIKVLRRYVDGTVTGRCVQTSHSLKKKTYQSYLRRSFAEAMLSNAVIVVEGHTEIVTLSSVASRLEDIENNIFPLDLLGVSIVVADGIGSIADFGSFFSSIGIPTYAIFDSSPRGDKVDFKKIENSGFIIFEEIPYTGMEKLLISETTADTKWNFLDSIRDQRKATSVRVPVERPDDDEIDRIAMRVLKSNKGSNLVADLVSQCEAQYLPKTITDFLQQVHSSLSEPIPNIDGFQPYGGIANVDDESSSEPQ